MLAMKDESAKITNPNYAGVQKTCPKCYKINFGDVDICNGCGADLSAVKTVAAGARNAGLFGFMPAAAPKMTELDANAPKKVIEQRSVSQSQQDKDFICFPAIKQHVRPWA